jgi:hypothetical protein
MENFNYYLHSKLKYKRAVPLVVSILKKRVGKKRAITQSRILEKVHQHIPVFTIRMLRMAIHEIRTKHCLPGLMADNSGYYIETDSNKLRLYLNRIDGYIRTQSEIRDAISIDLLHVKNQSNNKEQKINPMDGSRLLKRAFGDSFVNKIGGK